MKVVMRTKLIYVFFLWSMCLVAQTNVLLNHINQHEKDIDSLFVNHHLLYPIFEQWATIQDTIPKKSNILHLGDSHIQADIFTAKLRGLFQQKFGNAGRGFVFPYTLVQSYGNPDVIFSSNVSWESQSIISHIKDSVYGRSGVKLSIRDTLAYLRFETKHKTSFFQTLKVLVPSEDLSFCVLFNSDEKFMSVSCKSPYQGKKIYEFTYDQPQSTFLMYDLNANMAINGFILEHNDSGILYHNIGVNGAKASDFIRDLSFFDQLEAIQANLIIVSLGTNESFDAVEIPEFCFYITAFLDKLRHHNPNAVLLVTTPPPSRSKKEYPNSFAAAYACELRSLLGLQNVVVFDMFQMISSAIAAGTFDVNLGFAADGVHYSKSGYETKASWFFDYIVALYEAYLKVKSIDANKH